MWILGYPWMFIWLYWKHKIPLVAQTVKHLPTMRETQVRSLGREDPLEKEMATHSSTLAWKIPWMEECDRLQSMGSQRVGHDWATSLSLLFIYLFLFWIRYFIYFLIILNFILFLNFMNCISFAKYQNESLSLLLETWREGNWREVE